MLMAKIRGNVMKQESNEKRGCSIYAPFTYFFLESVAILMVVYIITGGEMISRLGIILSFMGLLYPAIKLPTFVKRVVTCRNFRALNKERTRNA